MSHGPLRLALFGRRLAPLVLSMSLTAGAFASLAATPVSAYSVCNAGGDICVVYPDSVTTPLGVVTVTVSATNVVTVHLAPTNPKTLVFGVPFQIPPGPPLLPTYAHTTIDTAGGLVAIDTFQIPPGPPLRAALPSVAIISIHPPSPCLVSTNGTTVVFTPI